MGYYKSGDLRSSLSLAAPSLYDWARYIFILGLSLPICKMGGLDYIHYAWARIALIRRLGCRGSGGGREKERTISVPLCDGNRASGERGTCLRAASTLSVLLYFLTLLGILRLGDV